ncbi:MAG: hypothetical protein GY851_17225 [bacterium]|nr:hypothetical protein [bacterium]
MSTHSFQERAEQRRLTAEGILEDLELLKRWERYGTPFVVGAVAYDLVVSPDIDLEVYCPGLHVDHGFEVLRECARHPSVTETRFVDCLDKTDNGYYWQIECRGCDGQVWKIDTWSVEADYALPASRDLVEPMRAALTDDTRAAILGLKEARQDDPALTCLSVDLYRAVIDDGVRSRDDLDRWLRENATDGLSDWKPGTHTRKGT